jgi:hypothetical protein
MAAFDVFVGSFRIEYKINLSCRSSFYTCSTTEDICVKVVCRIQLNREIEKGYMSAFRALDMFPFFS